MPIKSLLSEMSVDVTKTEIICKAFDDAWADLKNADDTLADPSKASVIRTALARRIIEMAFGDGMNSGKLRDDAIAHIKTIRSFHRASERRRSCPPSLPPLARILPCQQGTVTPYRD